MSGETLDQITSFIFLSMKENKLNLQQLTSFCADNAPVNFGGSNQRGNNNVFYHLTQRKTYLITVGCPAHILHNVAEKNQSASQMTLNLTLDDSSITKPVGQITPNNSVTNWTENIQLYQPTRRHNG